MLHSRSGTSATHLVVETRWPGLRVVDYLDVAHGRAYEPAGRTDLVRVIEGDTRALIEFAPRVDFGRVPSRLEAQGDVLRVLGAGDSVQLVAPGVSWTIEEDGPHQRATRDGRAQGRRADRVRDASRCGRQHSVARDRDRTPARDHGVLERVGVHAAVAAHRAVGWSAAAR